MPMMMVKETHNDTDNNEDNDSDNDKNSYHHQIDIDLCNPNPCDNGAPCINTHSDYYCHCPEGWAGKNCSAPRPACTTPPCQGKDTPAPPICTPFP